MRSSCAINIRPELHQLGTQKATGAAQHPATQGATPKSLDTFWHSPHLIFLLGIFFVRQFFLSSKISWNFIAKLNFLFISFFVFLFIYIFVYLFISFFVLLLYSSGRILKGFYRIHLPEFDKYCFCSKVHRKQRRTNLPSPCWDQ